MSLQDGYILARIFGKLDSVAIKDATEALLKLSAASGIKRVLYDASDMERSTGEQRREEVKYAQLVREDMDKMATYVPSGLVFYTAKIIYTLAGIKTAQAFRDKQRAVEWLKAD